MTSVVDISETPRKRAIIRSPSPVLDPVLAVLDCYTQLQDDRARLPGYFNQTFAHQKCWPSLWRGVPPRPPPSPQLCPNKEKSVKSKTKIDYEPLISTTDDLNMIYKEDSMMLADVIKSPKVSPWKKGKESLRSCVSNKAQPVPGKRVLNNVIDFAVFKPFLRDAHLFLDTWAAEANTESDRTRQEAIHELILTEKSYIDDLLLVVEVFYNPLCAVASPVELSEVFVNWHQLILCNAKLFRALFDNRQNNLFTVGGVIVDEIDSLTLPYTKFCSCQRQAMQALAEATSAKFREIEKECGASPKVGKLPLSTFLLKPMQRITKYPLLIKKILQHSREDDPDYGQLKLALSKTEQLLVAVNEAVRTTSRLEVLQKSLVPDENSLGEKTVLNSCTNYMGERRLVHYGGLSKTRGAKELWGVLFNDSLWLKRVDRGRYGTTKPIDLDARDFDQIKFEHYREPFLLNDIILSEHTTDSIQFTHKDKPYIFHAVSEAQSKIWLDSLSQCVNEATSQYNRLYQTMVPDPLLKGQATLSLRVVEAGELALPLDDKQNSIYAQIALGGHIQRTPSSIPKWDHTMHFVVKDVNSAKVNITLHQSHKYSPNVSLGKFDLSLSKLLRSGSGPWNKRLILTDAASGVVNVSITLRHHGTASITAHR